MHILSNEAFVIRGGPNTVHILLRDDGRDLKGISSRSYNNTDVQVLASTPYRFKGTVIKVTTVGQIRQLRGQIMADGNSKNPFHASIKFPFFNQVEAQLLSGLFWDEPNYDNNVLDE